MQSVRTIAGLLCFVLGLIVVMSVAVDLQMDDENKSRWVAIVFLFLLGVVPMCGGGIAVYHGFLRHKKIDAVKTGNNPFWGLNPWFPLCVCLILSGVGSWWKLHTPEVVARSESHGILRLDKQKLIWDAEHVTFEIETHFAKRFSRLLAEREVESLTPFFRKDFRGRVLQSLDGKTKQHSVVSEVSYPRQADKERSVDASGLVEFLMESIQDFREIDRNRLRVLKINKMSGESGLWHVELLLTFHGKGASGQLLALESRHQAELRFQADEEIAAGEIVTRWDIESTVIRSSPVALMEEVTQQVGLADLTLKDNWLETSDIDPHRYQIAVEDFDRDGFQDIAIASVERAWLLRSVSGKKFVDITPLLLPEEVRHPDPPEWGMPVWIDYDNDSYPDLLIGNKLFHNEEGKNFVDVTEASGLRLPSLPMGCAVADYDCDGLLDFYVVYQQDVVRESLEGIPMKPAPWVGDDHSGSINRMWHNEGGGRFRDVTEEAGVGGLADHSFAAVWFYFDEDRFPDLYVANDFGKNMLLRNRQDGTFEDVTAKVGADDFATSMGVAAGDLDNDGTTELYVANMYSKMGRRIIAQVEDADYPDGIFPQIEGSCAGNRLYQWSPTEQRFHEQSTQLGVNQVGWAYAPAMADFDGDGWLDLYATTGYLSFNRGRPDG